MLVVVKGRLLTSEKGNHTVEELPHDAVSCYDNPAAGQTLLCLPVCIGKLVRYITTCRLALQNYYVLSLKASEHTFTLPMICEI